VKKPQHQWETRRWLAVREEGSPGGAWVDDPRAEAFALRSKSGAREGRAVLGLRRQEVDAAVAEDPDLVHAVCSWLAARGARRIELQDGAGRTLERGPFDLQGLGTLPAEPPRKLVTLAPSIAEMVDALGVFDRVIACEDSSDHPPEVRTRERLGPDLGPDLDRIAALSPDLVLSSLTVPGMERIVTGLRARGVPQLVLAPRRYGDVLAELQLLGRILGVPDRAVEVVADMERQRGALEAARVDPPVRTYLEWWPRPMFTPGRDCYSNELLAFAGAINVFGDREGSSVQIEPAEVVAADPELCFVSWCGVAEAKLDPSNLMNRPGLEHLTSARAGRVYPLDEAFSGRPGPRMLEASRRIAAAIRGAALRESPPR
jgi:ABC-type Fe3+-hydroxamate transport system substrate-binding protein